MSALLAIPRVPGAPAAPNAAPAAANAAAGTTAVDAPVDGNALPSDIGAATGTPRSFELAMIEAAQLIAQAPVQTEAAPAEPGNSPAIESSIPDDAEVLELPQSVAGGTTELRLGDLRAPEPTTAPQTSQSLLQELRSNGPATTLETEPSNVANTRANTLAPELTLQLAERPDFSRNAPLQTPTSTPNAVPTPDFKVESTNFSQGSFSDPGFSQGRTPQDSAQTPEFRLVDPAPIQDSGAARVDAANPSAAAREAGETREGFRALPELPARTETNIVRGVRVLADEGGGTARIRLDPPELGGLNVRVTVTDQGVTVSMLAERMPVAELMGRHIAELRQSLEAQGLRVDHFEVDSDEGRGLAEEHFANASDLREGSADARHQDSADGGTSNRGSEYAPSGTTQPGLLLNTLGTVDLRV